MPTIELSQETYTRLLRRSESFSDTAENVVQRLLDNIEAQESSLHILQQKEEATDEGPLPRAAPGSILPEREYWLPILEVIADAGGSAAASDVIDALEERMRDVLKPRDYETLTMGEVRWRNRARFARLRMTEQKLLSATSHRGLWEITAAGCDFLANRGAKSREANR